jgi:hypothetical protein
MYSVGIDVVADVLIHDQLTTAQPSDFFSNVAMSKFQEFIWRAIVEFSNQKDEFNH